MALILQVYGSGVAKGKLGSTVFQRSPYGLMMRMARIPVNPNTAAQQIGRLFMSSLAITWNDPGSGVDYASWAAYALGTPYTGSLGNPISIPGRQQFIKTNMLRLKASQSVQLIAPATPGGCPCSLPTITASVADGIEVTGVNPVLAVGERVFFRLSTARNTTKNYFTGPWNSVVNITSTTTFPFLLRDGADVEVGQRYFIKVRRIDADGKVSSEIIVFIDVLT